eukprot:2187319-Prorocentrum_lima.AAC.1
MASQSTVSVAGKCCERDGGGFGMVRLFREATLDRGFWSPLGNKISMLSQESIPRLTRRATDGCEKMGG